MTARTTSARTAMLASGIVVVVVGVLAAAGLWYSASQRYEDAVRNLARAPIGCVTTLDFAETGDYLLFVETRGSLDVVVGDCGAVGDFEWAESALPSADVILLDPRGDEVGLDPRGEVSYDAGGSTGRAVQGFRVATAGDHLLTVAAADDDGFAIAVGRDPSDGVGAMRLGAAIAAIAGLVIGGGLLVASTRRRSGPPAEPQLWPGAGWVTTPPGMSSTPDAGPWRPAVGPPTRPPGVPGQPPLSGGPPAPPGPATAPPSAPPGVPPVARPAVPPFGDGSSGSGSSGDGSSGDGERSPWAPPDDRR